MNLRKGIPFVLINLFFFSVSRTCAKFLYEAYPDMTTFQFVYLRACTAFIFNIILINRRLKHVLWDSIGRGERSNLITKVIVGMFSTFLSFSAIKYFPLTYVTAVRQISPFFALVMSCVCL